MPWHDPEKMYIDLHLASINNDLEGVKELLKNYSLERLHPDLNYSLLTGAIENNYYEMVELLIQNGANVDYIPKGRDCTALSLTVHKKDEKMLNLLIKNGVHLDSFALVESLKANNRSFFDQLLKIDGIESYIEQQNLHRGEIFGDEAVLFHASEKIPDSDYIYYTNRLLDLGMKPIDIETMYGTYSPLINVIGYDYDLTKRMLDLGANPNVIHNAIGNEPMTPLRKAIKYQDIETIKLLLEYGADPCLIIPYQYEHHKTSAISTAAIDGNIEILTLLFDHITKKNGNKTPAIAYDDPIIKLAITDSVAYGQIDSLEFFGDEALKHHSNPDALLLYAVDSYWECEGSDYLSVVRKLLTVANANPNAYKEESNSETGKKTKIFAVQLAAINNRYDLCKELIEAGASVKPRVDTLQVLFSVIKNNNKRILSLFLQNGATPDIPNQMHLIPLAYAMKLKREDLLPDLAEYTAGLVIAPNYMDKVLKYTDGIDPAVLKTVLNTLSIGIRKPEKQKPTFLMHHPASHVLLLENKMPSHQNGG